MVRVQPGDEKAPSVPRSLSAPARRQRERVRAMRVVPARALKRPIVAPDGAPPLNTGALTVATKIGETREPNKGVLPGTARPETATEVVRQVFRVGAGLVLAVRPSSRPAPRVEALGPRRQGSARA